METRFSEPDSSGGRSRRELLRLGEPKPKVSHASLLIALDAGYLCLRHDTWPQLSHQLHPPHKRVPAMGSNRDIATVQKS